MFITNARTIGLFFTSKQVLFRGCIGAGQGFGLLFARHLMCVYRVYTGYTVLIIIIHSVFTRGYCLITSLVVFRKTEKISVMQEHIVPTAVIASIANVVGPSCCVKHTELTRSGCRRIGTGCRCDLSVCYQFLACNIARIFGVQMQRLKFVI